MYINAGLGNIDDYPDYVEAGASELFCGYVPQLWTERFGPYAPLNRREVLYANVQLGSRSELHILKKMVDRYHVPVNITLNALHFAPEQYQTIVEIMEDCIQAGFHSFILADPALLWYLNQQTFSEQAEIIISGETGEINRHYLEWCRSMHASRVIFHRKLTTAEIRACISADQSLHPRTPLTYEAFILNELCHYTGAFCNSVHCDAFAHLCRVPWKLSGRNASASSVHHVTPDDNPDLPGATGCGLCALWRLRAAGITHLKLVSRGNYTDATIQDIRLLRKALNILEQSGSETAYIVAMLEALFPDGCSHNCYYPEAGIVQDTRQTVGINRIAVTTDCL